MVIHLIDWHDRPQPFAVELTAARFFPGHELAVELLTPVPYEQAAHEKAEDAANAMLKPGELAGPQQAKAYSALSQTKVLPTKVADGLVTVEIPKLNPWGILRVGKGE